MDAQTLSYRYEQEIIIEKRRERRMSWLTVLKVYQIKLRAPESAEKNRILGTSIQVVSVLLGLKPDRKDLKEIVNGKVVCSSEATTLSTCWIEVLGLK